MADEEPHDAYTTQHVLQQRLFNRHGYKVITSPVGTAS